VHYILLRYILLTQELFSLHCVCLQEAGLPTPAVNQIEIHPLCTQTGLLQYMRKRGILPVAYRYIIIIIIINILDYSLLFLCLLPASCLATPTAYFSLTVHQNAPSVSTILSSRITSSSLSLLLTDELMIFFSSLAPASTWRTAEGQDSAKTAAHVAHHAIVQTMLEKYNINEAQLLLRWALQHDYCILPKSCQPERIEQNTQLFHFSIDDADMSQLDELDENLALAWPIGNPLSFGL
jgi:hypothetical protein